jgi:hypothetical protein
MTEIVERLRGWAAYMPQSPESEGMVEAAATIAEQAAEIERLRAAMREAYRLIGYRTGNALEQARTALAEVKS